MVPTWPRGSPKARLLKHFRSIVDICWVAIISKQMRVRRFVFFNIVGDEIGDIVPKQTKHNITSCLFVYIGGVNIGGIVPKMLALCVV